MKIITITNLNQLPREWVKVYPDDEAEAIKQHTAKGFPVPDTAYRYTYKSKKMTVLILSTGLTNDIDDPLQY